MSVISFWNALDKENGQTCTALAIATYMAMEHNLRVLLIDATFQDKTMERAFWKKREDKALKSLTGGKIDVSSGAEGLISAVSSNKATPEIITNYTKIVFKNRLDVLLGLKTEVEADYAKSLMLYKDLILTANKFYDIVLVDLAKGNKVEASEAILKNSTIIIYAMPPNLVNIDKFNELKSKPGSFASTRRTIPLLAKSDESSEYNVRNASRYMKERELANIPYNVRFMESINESRLANFMTSAKLSKSALTANGNFFKDLSDDCQMIIDRIKELNK